MVINMFCNNCGTKLKMYDDDDNFYYHCKCGAKYLVNPDTGEITLETKKPITQCDGCGKHIFETDKIYKWDTVPELDYCSYKCIVNDEDERYCMIIDGSDYIKEGFNKSE